MTEVKTQRSSTTRTVGLVAAGAVIIGGVVFGAVQLSNGNGLTAPGDQTSTQPADGEDMQSLGPVLPKAMGGQQAIDALGDDINQVAKKNNMTVEKLEGILLKDSTAYISKTGFLLYGDAANE